MEFTAQSGDRNLSDSLHPARLHGAAELRSPCHRSAKRSCRILSAKSRANVGGRDGQFRSCPCHQNFKGVAMPSLVSAYARPMSSRLAMPPLEALRGVPPKTETTHRRPLRFRAEILFALYLHRQIQLSDDGLHCRSDINL